MEGTTKLLRLGILWYSPNTGEPLLSKMQSFEQIGRKSWETVSLSQIDPHRPSHVKEDPREDKWHRQRKPQQKTATQSSILMCKDGLQHTIPERAKVGHLSTTSCVIHCSLWAIINSFSKWESLHLSRLVVILIDWFVSFDAKIKQKSSIIFTAISLSYYPNICTDKNCYWKRQSDTPRNGGKSPKLEEGSSQSSYTLHSSASGASLQ
jgi:hypothetical protein